MHSGNEKSPGFYARYNFFYFRGVVFFVNVQAQELSAKFFRVIKPFMPFTYTVQGFRSSIATGRSNATTYIVMIALAAVFTLLMIPAYKMKWKREKTQADFTEEPETTSIASHKQAVSQ